MTNRWCSIPTLDTHLPLLPCPSSRCREKLKQVDPRFFFCVCVFVFSSSLFPSSTSGHRSLFICLPFFLYLPLSWSLHGSGWESRQALGRTPHYLSFITSHKWQLPLPTHTFTSAFLMEDNVLHVAVMHQRACSLKAIETTLYINHCVCA